MENKMFTFTELSETAKKAAIDHCRYFWVDCGSWYEFLSEKVEEQLENAGFRDPQLQFSGFSSQGDGASFTAEWIDIETFLRHIKKFSKYRRYVPHYKDNGLDYSIGIYRRGNYCHEHTMRIDDHRRYVTTENQDYKINEICELILDFAVEAAKDYYKTLETEYEYLTSDQQVIDGIEANDYLFLEDGRFVV